MKSPSATAEGLSYAFAAADEECAVICESLVKHYVISIVRCFIAVPFAAVVCKSSLVVLLASLCFCLESVSVMNTFFHAVVPLHVSLIRSALTVGLSCLLGLILIALCRVIFRNVAKSSKSIEEARNKTDGVSQD